MTSKTTERTSYAIIERSNGQIERIECTQRPFHLAANSPKQSERREWWDKINTAMAQANKGKVLHFEIEETIRTFKTTQEAQLWDGINEGGDGWEPAKRFDLVSEQTKTTIVTY